MKKSVLVLIVAVVALALWAYSGYNGMVDKEEAATTALSNVETQYQRRADLIPNVVEVVKGYAKHEKETFEAVTQARNAATQIHLDADGLSPEKLKEYEAAQNQLAQAFSRLIAVSEAYPELKANENFKSLQDQLEGCENRISEARKKYNESVQDYNTTVRHFPNSMLAGIFGFDRMEKFQAAAGSENAPKVKF
ncbi:LemA family protein [Prevotella sp. HUN102]|uniref:LemA family protein n=1 Tax=Prevotella sp. HUN102 TaxID=1392486 RepID=UPI00048E5192|nr:LemA family protein [Prevotella sp. HUN102]